MRITILGLPGSGKSTLAKKISKKLQIPAIHIDRFWLEAGGGYNSESTPDPEKARANVKKKVLEAIQAESWVSDGVYGRIQPQIAKRADTVIFLDIPLWRRLLNHAARTAHRGDSHSEITFWRDMVFFVEIVKRDFTKKSKLKKLVNDYREKAIILRSRKQINEYLRDLV